MASREWRSGLGNLTDQMQINRRANLRQLIAELAAEGVESEALIEQVLGLRAGMLGEVLQGGDVPDNVAREIEWAMNRPPAWLDRGPAETDI